MAEKKEKQYVSNNARLMAEWDWEKNNNSGFFPDKLTHGCGVKVWWLCPNNHSHLASVSHKSQGKGCPYCARRKILVGFNDLQTVYPSIAKEWNQEKNHPLSPTDVVGGSHKIVWWTCPKNHDYDMSILDRTQGLNCPICSGKRIIEGVNDLATTHPQFICEWNWEKNNELKIFPNKIPHGSNKKVWWKCNKCQYEWQTSPGNRSRGTNCPVCANRIIIAGKNDLLTRYPLIAKKWHPTLNQISPSEVAPTSNKKVYWQCEKDNRHYFYTRIDHMVIDKTDCPVCANQSIIVGINDLATTHPSLISEWDFNKNKELLPQSFTYGNTRKVWWKCKKGHNWQATIASRTSQKCGCPICSKELRVSFPETIIAYYLNKEFQVERSKHFNWLKTSEIDIYLPEFLLGIEYDGAKWHRNITRDIEKDKKCLENNIQLIRIRESGCADYKSSAHKIFMSKRKDSFSLETAIKAIFNYIHTSFHVKKEVAINIQRDYDEILQNHIFSEKEQSIKDERLLQEWNYKKNHPLTPDMFRNGSDKKVWWICSLGHEWKATIYSRTNKNGCNCPYCAGKKVIPGWNDLQTLYPEIAKEWDFDKNGDITPDQIRPQTNKKYWWICSKCNHSWLSNGSDRIGKSGCPKCGRARTIQSRMKRIKNLDTNEEYPSAVIAGKLLNISPENIRNCCNGKTKTAGGYRWIYL